MTAAALAQGRLPLQPISRSEKHQTICGVATIDTRIETEYNTEHIPGAINAPYTEKNAKSAVFNPSQDKFYLSKPPANKNDASLFIATLARAGGAIKQRLQ